MAGGMFGGLNFEPLGWSNDAGTNEGALSGGNNAIARAKSSITTTAKSIGIGNDAIGVDAKPIVSEPIGAGGNGGSADGLASYFMRAIVIILGFIFVATGLTMFGRGQVTQIAKAITK